MIGSDKSIQSSKIDDKSSAGKPWKQKRKTAQNEGFFKEVEIFEGKPVAQGPCTLESTSVENGYICIACADESQFLVPSKVVDSFECIDVILHSEVVFKERLENFIRFPDMRPEVMETVLRFVFIEHLNKLKAEKYWGFESPRLVFQFEVEPGQVMDLIHAAHFLGVKTLLSVSATMVAHNLKDVPDLSSLPSDLAWCIAEQFSAQDLFDAEERPDFIALNLDTDSLWEKHCKKLLQDDIVKPVSASSTYPSYDTWDFHEGPPPMSWKSLYVATYLQRLADRQNGGENASFMAEVSRKGKYAYVHTIRPMFWEWVISGQGSLTLFMYTSSFTNLLYLSLAKLPLGSLSKGGIVPCLSLGDILRELPLLQCLDASETGSTTEAAVYLSTVLQQHERIQVLRLAYNSIQTQGFAAIAQALPTVRTLKLLDVRENGIGAWVCQDVVEALQASVLEELLLEGNFRFTNRVSSSSNASLLSSTSRCSSRSIQDDFAALGEASNFQVSLEVLILSGLPKSLKHLQLSQCELTDSRMKILAKTLIHLSFIQKLDLSDNKITAEGATPILLWLQGNETLLELCLSNNKITDSCALVLSRVICNHTSLEKLSLKANYSYSDGNLHEVLNAAMERGLALHLARNIKFTLDLRSTDIPYLTRGRIQRQINIYSNVNLFI